MDGADDMHVTKTEGLVAAPFTPMTADGRPCCDSIGRYATHLFQRGVVGAFICGTTGEGVSLSVTERQRVAEAWMRAAPDGFRIVVHVGATSLEDCRTLAAHAGAIGADAIACLAPFFFRPVGVAGVVEWCAAVAEAAPSVPCYYYHIPAMTGVPLRVAEFLAAAGPRMPSLVGIKFSADEIDDLHDCLRADGGRYDVLFGRDERLVEALALGVRGAVGSTYNFAAAPFVGIAAARTGGDWGEAERLQAGATRLIEEIAACCPQPLPAFKAAMARVGIDCGPVRPPLRQPSAEQRARIEAVLAAHGHHGRGVS